MVIEYGEYTEKQEIDLLEEIYNRMLGEIKKNPLYLNSKTIVVNCIPNRQSALTKALYKQAEVGLESILVLRCGYTQKDRSFRMQRIWDSPFNNQRIRKPPPTPMTRAASVYRRRIGMGKRRPMPMINTVAC